jgi:hypothetical protein
VQGVLNRFHSGHDAIGNKRLYCAAFEIRSHPYSTPCFGAFKPWCELKFKAAFYFALMLFSVLIHNAEIKAR